MDERGSAGERSWWISAATHSCSAVAGAVVAVAVIAAAVGLGPRERIVRVPVYRQAPPPAASERRQEPQKPRNSPAPSEGKTPSLEPARVLPPLLPPAPVMLQPRRTQPAPSGVKMKVRTEEPPRQTEKAVTAATTPLIEGLAAAERGEIERAIELLERASAGSPNDPVPLIRLAELYERRMTAAETVEEADKWRRLASEARKKAVGLLEGNTRAAEGGG